MNSETLQGNVALVTGGGRGIGKAVAIALAAAGAKVGVTGRGEPDLIATADAIRAAGGISVAAAGDVTSAADVRRVVAEVVEQLGPVDVLINNAGVLGEFASPWESDAELWWHTIEVNLRGPMLFTREVLPGMVARRDGRVVNIGSYIGVRPTPGNTAYATSKAALSRYTDSLAAAVADEGVKVFVVSPGLVRTAMSEQLPGVEEFDATDWVPIEQAAAWVVRLARGDGDTLTGRFLHVLDDFDALVKDATSIVAEGYYQLRLLKPDGPVD
jgi:NAD(P)-dependent dehydrogenase (short-subunit alcohol dehydrogenase family)